MKKIKQFIARLAKIPTDKYMHLTVGMIVAAFCALVVPTGRLWCAAPVIVLGLAKEVYDQIDYGGFDWVDFLYTAAGGLIIQVFAWI